jgi:hypothetical protein
MIVVCAWCEAEGRPSVIEEREPLDDRSLTHTACSEHRDALLEQLRRVDKGSNAA